jgi:RNase adapter protein RapZ
MIQQINERDKRPHHILIVTGLAGAGKASVMRALEDVGFYCVDNLPILLLSTFLNLIVHHQQGILKIAIGVDLRDKQFLNNFFHELEKLKQHDPENPPRVIFVNASTQTLLKRFQETRRNHPLREPGMTLEQTISHERSMLEPVMASADMVLDTDVFNIHELRRWVEHSFAHERQRELIVNLMSFGFKYGVPSESNLVFDVRSLPNPYFVPELKALDGKNTAVTGYLFSSPVVLEYWEHLAKFLHYSLERFYHEGRFFVTVAVGCTGGKHRSVAFIEKIAKQEWPHMRCIITHRDIEKE